MMKNRKRKNISRVIAVILSALIIVLTLPVSFSLKATTVKAETKDLSDGVSSTDWMSGLPDDVALSDLSIPGTHDSGTCWTWDNTMFSVCQDMPIGEHSYEYITWYLDTETITYAGMLNSGVRYFDLRLHDDDGLGLYHGFSLIQCLLETHDSFWGQPHYEGLTMDKVMKWAREFLADHPGETLIFQVANETDSAATDCPVIYKYFHNLATEENSIIWSGDHVPTLGEARGKIVLFMNINNYGQSDYDDGKGGYWAIQMGLPVGDTENKRAGYAFSFNDFDAWTQNKWEDLTPEEKRDYVYNTLGRGSSGTSFAEDIVHQNAENGKKTWFISYASANTFPSHTPSGYAEVVNPCISGQIAPEGSDAFCGILAMDFVSAYLAQRVWATNYNRLDAWGPVSYSWSDDYSRCTATHYKRMDPSVSESVEAINIDSRVVKEATCDSDGSVEYTAHFNCAWTTLQKEQVLVPMLGHLWEGRKSDVSNSMYVWCSREGCAYDEKQGYLLELYGPQKTYDGLPAHIDWDGKMDPRMRDYITFECTGPSGEKISAGQDFVRAGTYTAHLILHGKQDVDFEDSFTINKRPVIVCPSDQVLLKGNAIKQGVSYVRLSPVEGEIESGLLYDHSLSEIKLSPEGPLSESADIEASGAKIIDSNGGDMTDNYDLRYQTAHARVMDVLPDYTPPTAREDMVYDGTENELIVPGVVEDADYVFKYALSKEGPYSSDVPKVKDAGHYTVWWYVTHKDELNANEPLSVTVHVLPKTAELKWSDVTFVYDGNFHAPTCEVSNLAEGDSCEVSVIRGQMDAGKHHVAANDLSNKNYVLPNGDERIGHYYIAPRGITVSGIGAEDKVYDGTTDATLNYEKVSLEGVIEGDKLSVSATGTFENSFAGERSVVLSGFTLSGRDAGNYDLPADAQQTTATATITKRPVIVRALDQHIISTGTLDTDAAILEQNGDYPLIKDHMLESVELTTDWPGSEKPSGYFTISVINETPKIFCNETDVTSNYDITCKNGTLMVVEATPEFTAPQAIEGLVYDGTMQQLVTPGVIESENYHFEYALSEPYAWKEEVTVGCRAGDYEVFYRIVNADGVPIGSIAPQKIDVSIARRPLTVVPDEGQGKTYGEEDPELTFHAEGWADPMEKVHGSLIRAEGENAGEYAILQGSVTDEENHNYTISFSTGVNFRVDPAPVTLTAKSGTTTYNGEEQTVTGFTPDVEGLTFAETVKAEGKGTNAGEYAVTFSGVTVNTTKDTTGNYVVAKTTDGKLTIKKAPSSGTSPVPKDLKYNGQPQELVEAGTAVGGTMQYALSTDAATKPKESDYTISIPSKTDAGTYYVWYKVAGDENHDDTKPACVSAVIRAEISYDVTFKVVHGLWNDETKEDKTVTLTGYEGDTLKLTADQIPSVGNKPDDTYMEGSWDVTPDTETAITGATTYTYTYGDAAAKEVTDAINNLPAAADIKLSDKDAVEAARASYEALPDERKTNVSADTLKKLTDAEDALGAIQSALENLSRAIAEAEEFLFTIEGPEEYAGIRSFLDEGIKAAKDVAANADVTKAETEDAISDLKLVLEEAKNAKKAVDNQNPFTDIKIGTWQYKAAKAVYDKGIMTGTGTVGDRVIFSPNKNMNRSQFVQALYSMDGKPAVTYVQKFKDVKEGDWFASAVTWASDNGIAAGNADGTFGVNGQITREQLALMLYKYAQYKKYDTSIKPTTDLSQFTDKDKVHSWAYDAVRWAVERGIISGKGSAETGLRIDPTKGATRIECAAMINRFCEYYDGIQSYVIEDYEEPIALPAEETEDIPLPGDEEIIDDEIIDDEDVVDDEDKDVIDDEDEDVIDDEDKDVIDDEDEDVIDDEDKDDEDKDVIDDKNKDVIDDENIDDENEDMIDDENKDVIDDDTEGKE